METKLINKAKVDNALMRGLKVKEIGHTMAWTDRGNLILKLRAGEDWRKYKFCLDAVPVTDKLNQSLLKLYFS